MTKTILILAIAAAFVAGTLTTATIVTAEGDTIQACIDKKGKVRIVDSPADCKNKETPIEWNIQGPPGPAGTATISTYMKSAVGEIPGDDFPHDVAVSCDGGDIATGGGYVDQTGGITITAATP